MNPHIATIKQFDQLENKSHVHFLNSLPEYLQTLEKAYKHWFPKAKHYSDYHIMEHNVHKRTLKMWYCYQFACMLKSANRIMRNIVKFEKDYPNLIISEVELLKEYVKDSKVFLTNAAYEIDQETVSYNVEKNYDLDPREIMSASRMVLRNTVVQGHPGEFATRYCSIFLIRQALEVCIRKVFGVVLIQDENGKIQKLNPEFFFEYIDDSKQENTFPIKKATLKKLHQWTQLFIHGGFIPYIWQIEWSHYMLEPIISGSPKTVKVKKSCLNNIESDLKTKFNNPIITVENSWKYAWVEEN